jgi:hypothetical protein
MEALNNLLFATRDVSVAVGVLDSQCVYAPQLLGKEVAEQRGTDIADVGATRWTGSIANANGHGLEA